MRLVDLRDLLLTITPNVFHYFTTGQTGNYILWAEDGETGSSDADDCKTDQAVQGTIDYFTKTEFDPNFDLIQEKLNSVDIAWKLNSIHHEQETGYIHYEWDFEIDNIVGDDIG